MQSNNKDLQDTHQGVPELSLLRQNPSSISTTDAWQTTVMRDVKTTSLIETLEMV